MKLDSDLWRLYEHVTLIRWVFSFYSVSFYILLSYFIQKNSLVTYTGIPCPSIVLALQLDNSSVLLTAIHNSAPLEDCLDLLNKFLDKIPTRRITASLPQIFKHIMFMSALAGKDGWTDIHPLKLYDACDPLGRSAALDHPCDAHWLSFFLFLGVQEVDSCMSSWSHSRWSLMHRGILHIYMILQRNPLHPDLLLGVSPSKVFDTIKQMRLSIPSISNQRNIFGASRFDHFLWCEAVCPPLLHLGRLRSLRTLKASPEGDHAVAELKWFSKVGPYQL